MIHTRTASTILIIDDTKAVREELASYVAAAGHRALQAESGAEGLRLLREHRPALVLLDVVMPTMDGFKVAQAIKLDPQSFVPIILLTARTDFETRRRGHLAGADDFLTKPVNPDELAIRIDAMLRIKELTEALEEANRKLAELADTDGLTGVASRRRLEEVLDLEHERSRRYRRPLGVLIIDIDHFKRVNDTYLHTTGDLVLKTVASAIREMLRRSDLCGRYGGEEFVVVAPELPAEGALVLAERIRQHVASLRVVAGTPESPVTVSVTVSIGVAAFDQQGATLPIAQLLKRADAALYQAKAQGRNRVILAHIGPGGPPSAQAEGMKDGAKDGMKGGAPEPGLEAAPANVPANLPAHAPGPASD